MLCMVWTGIIAMDSIQKEKYTVDVDCVNLAKSMIYQQLNVYGKSQGRKY